MKFDVNILPSAGIPYAVKTIDVSPFRPKHMPFISEAIMLGNNAPLIEAVGMVMDFDVNQLTDGDFYYFLTWLRFNSRDIPMTADWKCEGTLFRRVDTGEMHTVVTIDEMVEQWEKAKGTEAEAHMVDPRSLEFEDVDCDAENSLPVGFEDFRVKQMPNIELDPRLDYPRVRHMVEYLELVQDRRYTQIIGPVRYIKEGFTLREKLEIVDAMEDMELFDKASKAHYDLEHGLMQRVVKQCPKCGTTHYFATMIDAQSFFV
jgi:ribosomal protein S27AE